MNILITNDDGIRSAGLHTVAEALQSIGDVYVLAPDRNWSVASHAKTLDNPLKVRDYYLPKINNAFTSNGSPADCALLGISGVLGVSIDVVVAGINTSNNLGYDVHYSGTIAAAAEATMQGVPSVAMSTLFNQDIGYDPAAKVALVVVDQVIERGLPSDTLLNVNVPTVKYDQIKGVKITRQANSRHHQDELVDFTDPYGNKFYWIGGRPHNDPENIDTDIGAVANLYVSVTPIKLNRSSDYFTTELVKWDLKL
tara:strand:- start:1438 stop:2199 length:762 start_codon:yes stop_codon:yes gene_type:complete